ncbi:hypothetical protein FACS1894172_12830 [Spirochaetia bacterium]|nr:hypothetical protein FACS1894164_08200 [Spirochaetia bacterium]GHU33730.1 hypothetical protein FACS1894172_12830 [Spirochaetia bacterium]
MKKKAFFAGLIAVVLIAFFACEVPENGKDEVDTHLTPGSWGTWDNGTVTGLSDGERYVVRAVREDAPDTWWGVFKDGTLGPDATLSEVTDTILTSTSSAQPLNRYVNKITGLSNNETYEVYVVSLLSPSSGLDIQPGRIEKNTIFVADFSSSPPPITFPLITILKDATLVLANATLPTFIVDVSKQITADGTLEIVSNNLQAYGDGAIVVSSTGTLKTLDNFGAKKVIVGKGGIVTLGDNSTLKLTSSVPPVPLVLSVFDRTTLTGTATINEGKQLSDSSYFDTFDISTNKATLVVNNEFTPPSGFSGKLEVGETGKITITGTTPVIKLENAEIGSGWTATGVTFTKKSITGGTLSTITGGTITISGGADISLGTTINLIPGGTISVKNTGKLTVGTTGKITTLPSFNIESSSTGAEKDLPTASLVKGVITGKTEGIEINNGIGSFYQFAKE